ncbi:putative WD repeat-containing protein [Wickerhamomyces ciferrii]|uniref:WD repeat-containing protein n=1 Tax=Wickerhamomyces ciferrii (strain ATCC 14091 / BCRC 22168 / CBS 111 / JCM 3599 / NBRC 0793 / NRRL Y-1031 F-60-10) TaxID=1206466 RepID=K0KRQ5_WICCF|nr:putative WD repeat-containing protein [Wickerhamomyces ciferrii]CCH44707.1 putative WD repeat-containing protein [Wickerhamomyces ciferrii]
MSDVEEVPHLEPQKEIVEESAIDLETQESIDEKNKRHKYRLLTGTFTSGQKEEYLQLGSVSVKSEVEEVDISKYDPDLEGDFDQKILHQGDINRARYMPQKPDLISTINNNGEVFIFDKTKHASQPSDEFKFDIKLSSHKKEGFGLSWNNHKEGQLLTCSIDGSTKLWDITKFSKKTKIIDSPVHDYKTDSQGTNDVSWLPQHDSIFSSVGEDNIIKIFDTRTNEIIKSSNIKSHAGGINGLSFNLHNEYCLSTADSNGIINIWDIRDLETSIFSINGHEGSISTLQFNPNKPQILATAGSEDNFVKLWDLGKPENDQLIFLHGGHMLGINDISWNPHDTWMISSVSNDNTLQIWKPSQKII